MIIDTTDPHTVVESADGVPIAVYHRGSGPPVLFVHGTGEDHQRWRQVTRRLSGSFSVYAVDRRGRGASGDGADYRLALEAGDLAAVVRWLGGRVTLVAHSYGAICALEAAVELPDLTGLLLYEPPIPALPSVTGGDACSRIASAVAAGDEEEGLCLFLSEVIGMPRAQVDLLRRVPGFRERATIARTIPREIESAACHVLDAARLAGLRVPTLVVSGEKSAPDLRDASRAVVAALPNARLTVLPGQAHQAMDTAPQLFIDVLHGFLRSDAHRPPATDR